MIDWLIGAAHAQGAAPGGPGGPQNPWLPYVLLIAPIVVFYIFLIYLPQRKRQQERARLMEGMKRGDEVLTAGGIYGKVAGITDQTVSLEIAPKVRIKVTKASIAQVTASGGGEEKVEEQK